MRADLSRRSLLLVGATAPMACASAVVPAARGDGSVADADPTDAIAPPDAAPDDAAPDARADAAPDLAVDAARDAAPDVAVDATRDATTDATADVPRDAAPDAARDVAVDAAPDVTVDAGPPCGLSDRFVASLPLSSVPARGGVVDTESRVVLARDAGGLYAFSAVCPHFGCTVEVGVGAATVCPCHGSTFDDDGVRLRGAATRSLANHPVAVCAGRVYVNRSTSVPVGTRMPVS